MATDQATLKRSLKSSYISLLCHINDNMTGDDKVKFELWCCDFVSKDILETNKPLKWFSELQRKGKISEEDLTFVEDFFKCTELLALWKQVKIYKGKREAVLKKMARFDVAETEGGSN